MRNLVMFIVAYLGIFLLGCEDTKDDVNNTITDLAHYRNIGHEIPVETGIRWMELYNKKNAVNSRLSLSPYSLDANDFTTMLNSVPDFMGVAFHHAIDESGTHHFIALPVGETLSVWETAPGRVYLDANTNTQISWEVARQWAANYEQAHPNDIWFHYFGANVFQDMLTIPFFNSVDIVPAISDLDLTPQLLLIIANGNLFLNGRTNNQVVVYDASSPCPPCPVE